MHKWTNSGADELFTFWFPSALLLFYFYATTMSSYFFLVREAKRNKTPGSGVHSGYWQEHRAWNRRLNAEHTSHCEHIYDHECCQPNHQQYARTPWSKGKAVQLLFNSESERSRSHSVQCGQNRGKCRGGTKSTTKKIIAKPRLGW